MRWESVCPCYWRRSPHLIGGRWCWINYWDHPQLTGRATCQCQRGLTPSAYWLSMVKKMPTTFLVMTDPKELFLFIISFALLPELGSPAELDWSFSVLLVFPFPTFMGCLSSFPSCALFSPSIHVRVTLVLWLCHWCEGSPLTVVSYTFGSMKNRFRSSFLVLCIVLF